VPDAEEASRVRLPEIDCLARQGGGAGKDGDLAVLDVQLNPSLLAHEPSARQLPDPVNHSVAWPGNSLNEPVGLVRLGAKLAETKLGIRE
jgi:hypothetical protein